MITTSETWVRSMESKGPASPTYQQAIQLLQVISLLAPRSSPIPDPRFLRRTSRHRRRSMLRSERNGASSMITTSEIQAGWTECKGPAPPTFQQAIQCLQEYWASVGCAVMQCSNTESEDKAYVLCFVEFNDSKCALIAMGALQDLQSEDKAYVLCSVEFNDSKCALIAVGALQG